RSATIERDGHRLAATLTMQAGDPPFPCVVFVHGLGSSKDSPRNIAIADRLNSEGLASLRFDLSNHGESDDDARGDLAYVADLVATRRWLLAQPGIDRRIGIAGSSYGASSRSTHCSPGR